MFANRLSLYRRIGWPVGLFFFADLRVRDTARPEECWRRSASSSTGRADPVLPPLLVLTWRCVADHGCALPTTQALQPSSSSASEAV